MSQKLSSFFNKVPRAIYYMSPWTPIRSALSMLFKGLQPGPLVEVFENKMAAKFDSTFAVAMPHARIGLHYALKCYEYLPDDEVLMTAINLYDMVNMVRLAGLRPVFVDLKKEDYSIDLEDLKSKVGPKSKFLILTHLNGFVPDMERIQAACSELGLILIQDSTQNYNSRFKGRSLTEFSEISVYSLCDLKLVHTHIGAMIFTNSERQAQALKELGKQDFSKPSKRYLLKFLLEDFLASFLLRRKIFSVSMYYVFRLVSLVNPQVIANLTSGKGISIAGISLFKGLYGGGGDVLRKQFPSGMLHHFSELQASIGLARLEKAEEIERKRVGNAELFYSLLEKTPEDCKPQLITDAYHTYWKAPLFLEEPVKFQKYLLQNSIDAAGTNLPCYSDVDLFKQFRGATEQASKLRNGTIYIPLHYYLDKSEVTAIAAVVDGYFESSR
ncbi:MAG: DegT/DnrJ/EryC1/StrS aminotransferase family protein [Halobacteriovoraceae bacterium]|nr:DegT/DnrJ/EryC1/StrS aminotransferase family protein [Halobacteriovoraceae bacterium]